MTAAVRRVRPRDRRDTIIRTACAAFTAQGYSGTSMGDIAAGVGVTSAALYRHFPSKQVLLGTVFRDSMDAVIERISNAAAGGSAAVFEAFVDHTLENRGLPRLLQLEVRNLNDEDRATFVRQVRSLIGILGAAIEQEPPRSVDDLEFLSWSVVSIVASLSYNNVQLSRVRTRVDVLAMIDAVCCAPIEHPATESVPSVTPDAVMPKSISTAAKLFNAQGYATTSIEDIGAAMGVSGPSLYHHFSSKGGLLNEILDLSERTISQFLDRAKPLAGTPNAALDLISRDFLTFAKAAPDVVGTAVSEAGQLPEQFSKRYRRIHRESIVRWADLICAASPSIAREPARTRVHAAKAVVADAVRNQWLRDRPNFDAAVLAVLKQIWAAG